MLEKLRLLPLSATNGLSVSRFDIYAWVICSSGDQDGWTLAKFFL